jgi:LuxR family transcriptional regulator, quorum-sensing system regulator LasR
MSWASTVSLIYSVAVATDEAQLLAAMKATAHSLGYDQVVFGIEMRLPVVGPLQHTTSGYPEADQSLYLQQAFLGRDPTSVHCQTGAKPLVCAENIYGKASHEFMEEAHKHGLSHGLSLAVRENARVVSMLSLARDRPFESAEEQKYVIDAGTILASCLHIASRRIIVPKLLADRRPHLSPRENQCFQLVAEGKSNWDIGQLLAISEAAAAFHVKNVLRKLRVSTRMQAVAIGVALGMIT